MSCAEALLSELAKNVGRRCVVVGHTVLPYTVSTHVLALREVQPSFWFCEHSDMCVRYVCDPSERRRNNHYLVYVLYR
jgi:hypothetical protein